jgi:hypothetical protein
LSQRTFLTGFAFVLLAAQACGSDDGKKNARYDGEAGAGGEAGQAEPGAGGSSAGDGPLPVAGMSGNPSESGGAGGQAPVDPTGGAGGEPVVVIPPDPEVLFSVKPGALGLTETGISATTNVQNVIYSSKTGKQEAEDGTNAVKITGESLGLAETDQIVAFAILQAAPKSPQYLISLADDVNGFSPGSFTTRANASYYGDGGAEEGDVYYSDGIKSFRDQGEGGDDYGYNAMLATEVSLGLNPGNGDDILPDDLTGLALHDANQAITELYFAVSSTALGADGTAVAAADPTERGCTVFKSALDGSNSVAFSCVDLGLLPSAANPDQIDALAIYGTTKPTTVVFSVTSSSQGAVESEVEAVRQNSAAVGATLFQTSGNAQNTVLKTASELGLYDSINTTNSEIDALAVIDVPNGKATGSGSCNVTYDPFDAVNGGGLNSFYGVYHIGDNVLVLAGDVLNAGARLLAYDATTCEFLKQVDLPSLFANTSETTIVPLAGWTQAKPFENVEYLRLETLNARKAVVRYDASGTFVQSFPIVDSDYYDYGDAIVYEPINDRVYLLMDQYYYSSFSRTIHVFPRPNAAVTEIDVPAYYRTHPCGYEHELVGTDPAGNLKIGTVPYDGSDYRVCTFTPTGELFPAPYFWTIDGDIDSQEGFFASDGTHYLLHQNPFSIERGTYQAP